MSTSGQIILKSTVKTSEVWSICDFITKMCQKWTSCKEKFRKENFQTGFVVAYQKHQLIKFEEEKRFGI